MTAWFGSVLHSSAEARSLGVKPAPLTVTTSPGAMPVQTGAEGLESSQVTPVAVEVSDNVTPGDEPPETAPATAEPSIAPPASTATIPAAANVVVNLNLPTVPPSPAARRCAWPTDRA